MSWLVTSLRDHPEIAIFLVIGVGHAVGRIRICSFRLNAVVGVLLVGMVAGTLGLQVVPGLEWCFLVLFLFAVGYQSGPQFFEGLRRGAFPQVGLSVFFCALGLASAYVLSRLFRFDAGGAAGLIAGGLGASPAMGTAAGAIAKLPVSETVRQQLNANSAVAFAVTYLVGLITTIFALGKVGPWLMRADLKSACRKLETELGIDQNESGVFSAYQHFVPRSYAIPELFNGKTPETLEQAFSPVFR
jgi:putative transport protein